MVHTSGTNWFLWFICFVSFSQPNKRDQPNKPNRRDARPGGVREAGGGRDRTDRGSDREGGW